MMKWRVGLILLFVYAAAFSLAAWTADPPDDGPGAVAATAVGAVLLVGYGVARFGAWLARRPRTEARGFPVVPLGPSDQLEGPVMKRLD
jgi:hypothetical protein